MISSRRLIKNLLFWLAIGALWAVGIGAYLQGIIWPEIDTLSFEVGPRTFEILAPQFFGLLLVLPALALGTRYSLSDLPAYQRGINLGLRALVIAAIVASLAQVVVTSFESRVATIFLVDTSATLPDAALDQSLDHINAAVDAAGDDDQIQVIAFADRPYLVEPNAQGRYDAIERAPSPEAQFDTDISAALRMAYGLFPDDHLKHAVLLTDGNETHGDFLAEVNRAADFGIRLFAYTLDYDLPPEVLIAEVDAPHNIEMGAPFYLTAQIFSTHDTQVDLTLWQDEYRDQERTVDVRRGMTEVQFQTEVSEPGFRRFHLAMDVAGADGHRENNEYVHTAHIAGEPRILYIEGEMRSRHHLERALADEDFDVHTRSPAGMANNLEELDAFDLILLSDVAADSFSAEQMRLLDDFVRQLGGGLIMAGGQDSFGPGGWQDTAVEALMPVTFESQQQRDTPSLAVLLVIDRSGSMTQERRLELARAGARAAIDELPDDAELGVVAFDHEATTLVPIQPVSNRARIVNQVDRLQVRGGTNIAAALREAYDQIVFHPARIRHMILLTDGISEEEDIFTQTLPALRIEDVTVSTVAVGNGAETSLMRRIADRGNGRFYYTTRPYDVPRIFVDETREVSHSSLVEEPIRAQVTGRSQVLSGIQWDRSPYLLGYVSTTPRSQAEVLLSTDSGEPLLARWRLGLGKTAVFTSDLKNRWGAQWVRWSGYPQFWAQLIRDTMRTDDRDHLPMEATLDQDRGRVVVDAIGADDRFINDLDSTIEVQPPDGEPRTYELYQIAPGRYETTFDLDAFGAYEITANHERDGATFAISQTSLSYPYPRGLSFTEANTELVTQAVELADGLINPSPDALFDAQGEKVRFRRPLWPYFAGLALLLLLLDLGFRRIRLSGKTDVSWTDLVGR